jgi:tetratricopeptide (TPR) repeat protein
VYKRIAKAFLGVAVLALVGLGVAAGQEAKKEKKVKDQAEYDLFAGATKETDPNKKLQLLNTWKEKYPDSDYKEDRLKLILGTYQQMGNAAKMADTAKEILATNPNDVSALYWLTLLSGTPGSLPATPDTFATGEKAAQGLLAAKKPPEVKEEDWKALKTEVVAHKTLGYIAAAKKDFETAEKQYAKVLELNPAYAEVSYQLGLAILQQKKPERQSEAIYHFARAASLTGTGEIPAANRAPVDAFFVKTYKTFHGSDEGMKELRDMAKANPMPPAGFKIKNKLEIEAENQEKFAKENPQLAVWKNVKDQLIAANGDQYFESSMKGSAFPKLKGKLISQKPAVRPKELVLGIENATTPEVTLKLENPLPGKAEPGTEIEFEGIPSAFTKEPFNVTFDVESKDKITGWPAAAPPARKAPATKKGAAKK